MNGNLYPPRRRSLVRRIARVAAISLAVLVVLVLAAIVIVPAVIPTSAVASAISERTKEDLGRPAELGSFSMSIIGGVKVTLSDLVIKDKEKYGQRPLLKVDKITVDADLFPLLGRRLVVNRMLVEQPEVSVVRGRDGLYNLLDIPEKPEEEKKGGGAAGVPSFKITDLTMSNGTIHFTDLASAKTSQLKNVQGQLVAQGSPDDLTGEISAATLTCDGFSASASGLAEKQGGNPVVRDFAIDAAADFAKLGPQLAALVPFSITGSVKGHLAAEGPINEIKTESRLVVADFQATGSSLRQPAKVASFESYQSYLLDLTKLSIRDLDARVKSDDLGVNGRIKGDIADLRRAGGLNLAVTAGADLWKLSGFANSFTTRPVAASGGLTAEGTVTGDPDELLAVKGRADVEDLRVSSGEGKTYSDPHVSASCDVVVEAGRRLAVKEFKIDSKAMKAEASGSVSAEGSDLSGKASADLAAASTVLAGLGMLPEKTSLAGKLDGTVSAKTAPGGVQGKFSTVVTDFRLASPALKDPYAEEKITLAAELFAGFRDGKLDSIKSDRIELASKLATVQATLDLDKLAATPSLLSEVRFATDLEIVGKTLAALGGIDEATRISGAARGTLTLATADRRPRRADRPAPAGTRTAHGVSPGSALFAFAGNLPGATSQAAALGQLFAAAPGEAPAQDQPGGEAKPRFIDTLTADGTATGEAVGYNEITFEQVNARMAFEGGVFTLDGTATLYDGSATFADRSEVVQGTYQHDMKFGLTNVTVTDQLTALLKRILPVISMPVGEIEGRFDGKAELTSAGMTREAMLGSMNGSGTIAMPQEFRMTMPVLAQVPGLEQYTDLKFGRMAGTFNITNGVVKNNATFTAPDLVMKMDGTTWLMSRKVDYRISLQGERVGRDLKRFLSKDGTLPIAISGTLDKPQAKIQLEGLLRKGLEELLKLPAP